MSDKQKWHWGLIQWESGGTVEVETHNLHKYAAEIEAELHKRGESTERINDA